MPTTVVDSENVVDSLLSSPDKLRAEIGEYYRLPNKVEGFPFFSVDNFSSRKIKAAQISEARTSDQSIIPIQRHTITFQGEESYFRDSSQWVDFVNQTVITNREFLDHTFNLNVPTIQNYFFKNFHHPDYEDSTKINPSNQLLNYNLLSYKYSVESIDNIGQIKTSFDQTRPSIDRIIKEYDERIVNYTGSLQEASRKQRNIFVINDQKRRDVSIEKFPFYYKKNIIDNQPVANQTFENTLNRYDVMKNILQSIKSDLSFSNRSFNLGTNSMMGKIYNASNLLLNTGIYSFIEKGDEIFLLRERELSNSLSSDRFVNQLKAVRFLGEMRQEITANTRDIKQIFQNKFSESFILGYKIEKYIDNDATRPIQTYFTINKDFIDTQIKYGRKYIYKTKVLIGIFGSSYSYVDLNIDEDLYEARVDVRVTPSFQILELDIDYDEVAFIDTPMFQPHVSVYGRGDKPVVNFLFQPRNFEIYDFGSADSPPIGNITEADQNIADLYDLSKDKRLSHKYFKGQYEIFRLTSPPTSLQSFEDAFLSSVDELIPAGNLDENNLPIVPIDVDYAKFSDNIVPNRKYYYAFRSITHNGTPSQLSKILEIELLRDSDDYKIVSKPYNFPKNKDHSTSKNAKRIIRIMPNIDRFLFPEGDYDDDNWELDNGSLVSHQTNTNNKSFKIRVTSKHTGKRIDLNITFRLRKDGSFLPPIVGPN